MEEEVVDDELRLVHVLLADEELGDEESWIGSLRSSC